MKKFPIAASLAVLFGLSALAGCAGGDGTSADLEKAPDSYQTELPEEKPIKKPEEKHEELPAEKPAEKPAEQPEELPQETPVISPLAILDTVDVADAFGDREAEGWSFALKAAGDLSASYGFRFDSEITDEEKVNLLCSAGVGLDDLFGVRNAENALGFELFGGGNANLSFIYRGPKSDSAPVEKSYDVGFRHDGDFVWYAGEGESETKTSLEDLKAQLEDAMMTETLQEMEQAFLTIPEELQKGMSLRFAVEKLIDLGFTLQIDDTDGLAISLRANAGFYTDLLNDMLEEFLPAKWLNYLPRADFGYERTVFDITLAFDANGIFREYSMSSDVALTASLEVRHLFYTESTVRAGGNFAITASYDLPAEGETADGAAA